MIKETYVNFETAKLLKEKGFNEKVISFYPPGDIQRPTQQMVMKWFREVHNIHINLDIHWLHFANKNGWMYIIVRILENGTEFVDAKGDSNDKHFYSTYEEACETAIKYCLENLI